MRRLANQRESRQGSEDLTLPSVCLIHPCCPVNLPTTSSVISMEFYSYNKRPQVPYCAYR
jgi:hypothetical protein